MVKNIAKYGIVLLAILLIGANFLISDVKVVPYGIARAKDNSQSVVVNDQTQCQVKYENNKIQEPFKKVAENEQLELYLEEESVAIAVKEKCSGYVWYSYDAMKNMTANDDSPEIINYIKSGISLVTYDKSTPGRKTVLDQGVEKKYQIQEDGFTAHIDFTSQQIRFDVVVTLQGGDVLVQVPQEKIQEYNPKLWKAGNKDISMNEIIVYPFFGSTTEKENGYIVIPDGAGAIVRLEDKPKYVAGYTAPVYGKDMGYENTAQAHQKGLSVKPLEKVSLPIFGIIHDEGKTGVLVVAERGSSYASYNYQSKGSITDYYQSFFTYNYRTTYAQFQSRTNEEQHILGFQKKPNPVDIVQRYVFLHDDQANYVGVAKKYQELLKKKEGFKKTLQAQSNQIPLKIDFINNEIKMGTLGIENVPVTTYNQAKNIVQKLLDKEYENLNVTFKTFSKDELGYHFDVMNHLGGKKDLRNTLSYFSEHNIKFNYFVDYAQSYYAKTDYTASKMNRTDFSVYNVDKNLFNYMNNPKYFKTNAEADMEEFKKFNIQSLSLGGLSGNVFSHFDGGKIGSSEDGMEYTNQLMNYLNEHDIGVNVYNPDAYMFQSIDESYETPIRSSELMFIDETIPLVPLILSGYKDMYSPYMNFSSNDEDSILRLIEFGVYPTFLLTGESTYNLKGTASNEVYVSELSYLEERLEHYYSSVNGALKEVVGSKMTKHEIIDQGIRKVTYSNGKQIIINFNDSDYLYKDIEIKAKRYVIL